MARKKVASAPRPNGPKPRITIAYPGTRVMLMTNPGALDLALRCSLTLQRPFRLNGEGLRRWPASGLPSNQHSRGTQWHATRLKCAWGNTKTRRPQIRLPRYGTLAKEPESCAPWESATQPLRHAPGLAVENRGQFRSVLGGINSKGAGLSWGHCGDACEEIDESAGEKVPSLGGNRPLQSS